MTLAYFAGRKITGTTTDRTGGTWTNLAAGWIFFETDTGLLYYWTGAAWTNGAKSPFWITGSRAVAAATTVHGTPFGSSASEWTTSGETTRRFPLNFTFEPKLLTVNVVANSLNGNCIVSFRDDGADVTNATVTVASTDTTPGTKKTSAAITATVATGSLICWQVDSTAAASGSATLAFAIEGYIYK